MRLLVRIGIAAAGAVVVGSAGCSLASRSTSSKSSPGTSSTDPLAQLEADTGVSWTAGANFNFPSAPPTSLHPTAPPPPWLTPGTSPADGAMAFFVKYGAAIFGMHDPAHELVLERSGGPDSHGATFASFTQVEGGVPVLDARISVIFDAKGRIVLVVGLYAPSFYGASTTPGVDAATAAAAAQADLALVAPAGATLQPPGKPSLTFDPVTFPTPELVYALVASYATEDGIVGTRYYVDAASGKVADQMATARDLGTEVPGSGRGVHQDFKQGFPVTAKASAPVTPPLKMSTAGSATSPAETMLVPCSFNAPSVATCDPRDAGDAGACKDPAKPGSLETLESCSQDAWDDGTVDPGLAVDAYVYLATADSFWRAQGLSATSFLPASTMVAVAHDPAAIAPGSAWFEPADGTFHFGPSAPAEADGTCDKILPVSAALDAVGHEYTHAIDAYVLGLGNGGAGFVEARAIDESLADIFGQFIEETDPSVPYSADFGLLAEGAVTGGKRSLRSPADRGLCDDYLSPCDRTPPCNGAYTYPSHDPHLLVGIPDNAWFLATWGGSNTTSGIAVDPATALGHDESLALYLSLYTGARPYGLATFKDLAQTLTGQEMAWTDGWTRILNDEPAPPEVSAVACAWYAVGVLTKDDLQGWGVTACLPPDAGAPGATTCGDDGDTNPYCLLAPACDVSVDFQLPGLRSSVAAATPQQVVCEYAAPGAQPGTPAPVHAIYTLGDLSSGGPSTFQGARDAFEMNGFTVVDVPGLGLAAYSASRTEAGVTATSLDVETPTVWFQVGSTESLDDEIAMAKEILSNLR